MKSLKFFNSLLAALLFIICFSVAGQMAGLDFYTVATCLTIATVLMSLYAALNQHKREPVLFAGIFREVWSGEVIRSMGLMEMYSWVMAITKDYSQYAKNVGDEAMAIHLASFPVKPQVLIDNNIYPLPVEDLSATDIIIALNKFQTTQTPITDDELFANTTSKMANVAQSHAEAILQNKYSKGSWNIAPAGDSAATPVITTTGGNDGTGRKMLVYADLLAFKRKLDAAKVSNAPGTRILKLSTDHENDLCQIDQKFQEQYFNYKTGKPYSALGFTFFGYDESPYYNTTTLVKQSLGVTPTAAMRRASVFFSTERVGKANGWTKAYLSPAAQDTANQRNLMNARHYHLITRLMNEGVGAIVSPNTP